MMEKSRTQMETLAIIPAREGSKRIKNKNIKDFLGKPIMAYSIEAAQEAHVFDEIMISTESQKIADIGKKYGAKIPFFRSHQRAGDFVGLLDVVYEVLNEYKKSGYFFKMVALILATSPLMKAEYIRQAYQLYLEKKADSVLSVVEYSFPIQRSLHITDGIIEMNWPENLKKRSQDLEKIYHDAGQFYFFNIDQLLKQKNIYMINTYPFILSNLEVQDIDTETDWRLAELKYQLLKKI